MKKENLMNQKKVSAYYLTESKRPGLALPKHFLNLPIYMDLTWKMGLLAGFVCKIRMKSI